MLEAVPKGKFLLDSSSNEILIDCKVNWRNEHPRYWDGLVEVNQQYISYFYLTLSYMKPFSVAIDIYVC